MKITTEVITPEIAKLYLAANTKNRPLSIKRTHKYAEAMKRGEFDGLNGDSIRFDSEGCLIDGQKRLSAVILSNVPLKTLIIRGLAPEAFKTIDSQETRTTGQRFATQKEKNWNALAAALTLLWKYKFYRFEGDLSVSPSFQQLESLLDKNDVRGCVDSVCADNSIKKLGSASIPAFCLYAFDQANEEEAEAFFLCFKGVIACSNKNPAFRLRERLQDNRSSQSKLHQRDIVAMWIKCFNAFQSGKQISQVRWTPQRNEPFPKINGYRPEDVK